MTPPRFIVLDGMDGAGKSSQIGPLAAWLAGRAERTASAQAR